MIWLLILVAIVFYSFWMTSWAPKKEFEVNFNFRKMFNEEFIPLTMFAGGELKWRVVKISKNGIAFMTKQSLGSYGEIVIVEYLSDTKAKLHATYASQKVGWGQLNRLYPKFIKEFEKIQSLYTNEELKSEMQGIRESFADYYEQESWTEV